MDTFILLVVSVIANIFLIIELKRITNERKKDICITKTKSIDDFIKHNHFLTKEFIEQPISVSKQDNTNIEKIANGLIDIAVRYLNSERPFRVGVLIDKSKADDFEYSKTCNADIKGYYNFFYSSANVNQTIAFRGYICEINGNELLIIPIPCSTLSTSIINSTICMDDIAYCLNQNLFNYILVRIPDEMISKVYVGNHVEIFGVINDPDIEHEFKYVTATKLSVSKEN